MLAELIKNRREELRMSQQALADALNTEQPTVSRWESGKVRPRMAMLLPLAVTLDIPVERLLQAATEAAA